MSIDETSKSYEEIFYEDLREPSYMCEYLKTAFAEAIEEQSFDGFMVSIHHAIEANELKKTHVAEESGLSRQHLYRVLNGESIPSFDKVVGLLASLGIQFDISLIEQD